MEKLCRAFNKTTRPSETIALNRMSVRNLIRRVLAYAIAISMMPCAARAGGPVQGARQAGMGTSFVAVADDLSAIAINPAGLVQLKEAKLYSGVTAIMPTTTYESPAAKDEHTQSQTFFAPSLFISSEPRRSDLVIGIGFFSLFGIGGRKWNTAGATRYLSTESTIGTMVANPTVAWRVSPTLSIGLGVDYLYALNRAERMVNQSSVGASDGKLTFDADGTGWGYNVGILLTPVDGFRVGLAYRSAIGVDQKGTTELRNIASPLQPLFGGETFKTDFETRLVFPERLTMGLSLQPTGRLTIATEVEWIRWSRFDRQEVNLDHEVPSAGFTDLSIELNWNDIWLLKIGAEYKLSDRLALRAGYSFVQSPVPAQTLSPSSPDTDSHNIGIGAGFRLGRFDLDIFYMAAFFESIDVDNDILDGTYRTFSHYLGMGVGYHF